MARRILSWLEENWPQSTPFLAIYSAAALFLLRDRMDLALMLIWLQTPVYFLHQFEEYIYPGGFLAFFNRKNLGSQRSDFPLTQTMSLWINVPVIFIGFPVSAYLAGRFGLSFGLWAVYFSVVNGLAHVIIFSGTSAVHPPTLPATPG